MRHRVAGFRSKAKCYQLSVLSQHGGMLASVQTDLVSAPSLPASPGHTNKAPGRARATGHSAPGPSRVSLSKGSGALSLHLGLGCRQTSQSEGHGAGKPGAGRARGSSWRPTSWTHLLESTSFSLKFRHFILLF